MLIDAKVQVAVLSYMRTIISGRITKACLCLFIDCPHVDLMQLDLSFISDTPTYIHVRHVNHIFETTDIHRASDTKKLIVGIGAKVRQYNHE